MKWYKRFFDLWVRWLLQERVPEKSDLRTNIPSLYQLFVLLLHTITWSERRTGAKFINKRISYVEIWAENSTTRPSWMNYLAVSDIPGFVRPSCTSPRLAPPLLSRILDMNACIWRVWYRSHMFHWRDTYARVSGYCKALVQWVISNNRTYSCASNQIDL